MSEIKNQIIEKINKGEIDEELFKLIASYDDKTIEADLLEGTELTEEEIKDLLEEAQKQLAAAEKEFDQTIDKLEAEAIDVTKELGGEIDEVGADQIRGEIEEIEQ